MKGERVSLRLVRKVALVVVSAALFGANAEAQPLPPSQAALLSKMKPEARFALDGVSFTGTTSTLQPASNKVLLDLAAVVKKHPETRLKLEVFVDPTDPGAQALSDKRAEILTARLKGFGAPAGAIEAVGLAGSEVLVPSIVEAMKAKNRRVMVRVIVAPGASPARTPVVVAATPAPTPSPLVVATPAPTPIATPAVASSGGARVTLVSTRSTPRSGAGSATSALRQAGMELVRIAQVQETRPVTVVYFTAQFQDEARRLGGALSRSTRLVPVKRIDPRSDLLVVLGGEG